MEKKIYTEKSKIIVVAALKVQSVPKNSEELQEVFFKIAFGKVDSDSREKIGSVLENRNNTVCSSTNVTPNKASLHAEYFKKDISDKRKNNWTKLQRTKIR